MQVEINPKVLEAFGYEVIYPLDQQSELGN